MKLLIHAKRYLILSLFFTLTNFNQLVAQEIFVFHVKGGSEFVGTAFLDTLSNQYVIETLDGKKINLDPSKIIKDDLGLFITNYARIFSPSQRTIPHKGLDVWTNDLSLHLSAKSITHYTNELNLGGEISVGTKWDDFIFGLGSGIWHLKDDYRYPVFVYVQKYLLKSCYKPFVIADIGFIFDRFTNSDIMTLDADVSSKFASLGLGLEIPLSRKFNLTVDAGYKYITIPTEGYSERCTDLPPIPVEQYFELHAAYLRLGISF